MRILLVAYYYPPRQIIGARRPAALAKHLRRAGHEVTVLTTALNAGGDGGGRAATGVAPELRARDLLATRLNWRRASALGVGAAQSSTLEEGAGVWSSLFVPDVQMLSWMPFATASALRAARAHRPDVVVSTSPAESAHMVGLALRRFLAVPWVADLRDGWRFEAPRGEWPGAPQRRLDDALERMALRRADAIVTVSEPLSTDLRERLGLDADTIPNGYDPEDLAGAGISEAVAPDRFTIVYTGGLGSKQTLRPVLDALARNAADGGARQGAVELVIAGALAESEHELLRGHPAAGMVRLLGVLPRSEALALQRAADLLLVVTSGTRRGEVTGKLLEYLGAGRPILVLGDDSEAARIVAGASAGWAIPVRDSDAAEAVLRRALAGEQPPAGSGAPREAYAYPALAARYSELLGRLVGDGSRPTGSARTSVRSPASSHSA